MGVLKRLRRNDEVCFRTIHPNYRTLKWLPLKKSTSGRKSTLIYPEVIDARKSTSGFRYLFKAPPMNTLLPYFVYMLISQKDQLLYIGYSSNLEKRVSDHNNGFTKSTAGRRPLQLIFCEGYLYKEDALKREAYFKTTAGKNAIRLMLNGTLLKLGYKPLLHRLSFEFDSNESWGFFVFGD